MQNFTISVPSKNGDAIESHLDVPSTTAAYPIDEQPLLILVLSLCGGGVVLVITVIFLCCYFYRTRLRRRNYPLTLSLQTNGATAVITTNGDSDISFDGPNRPRSPVTTEADIYGFGTSGTTRATDPAPYPTITESIENETKKAPSGFDNPMYKKQSAPSIFIESSEFPSMLDGRNGDAGTGTRKASSSTASAILPGLPSMLVVDESLDDHQRLVPNDSLSLEIDRTQRWLRENLEAKRHLYESEQRKAKDTAEDRPSINGRHISAAGNADVEDGAPKAQLPLAPLRKKLRRRLAETIANDRVLETTVTFASETPNSPATTPTPLLPGHSATLFSSNGALDIRRKYDSDDDLEVIFKERTPL